MDQMPEYEGMSESEKGFALMNAGLKVAAGRSENAIENVANGLIGLGPLFAKDGKEKRAWKRQVELSSAKYGLEQVAKNTAQDRADERAFTPYYDVSKKSPDNPYGTLVAVSTKRIIENNGQLPPNLVERQLITAEIAATTKASANMAALIRTNVEDLKLTSTQAESYLKRLSESQNKLESARVGIGLLGEVKAMSARGELSGAVAAGKTLIKRAFTIFGQQGKLNPSFNSVDKAKAHLGIVLQKLIPASLGRTQSANSISNRDVSLLADAYMAAGIWDPESGLLDITILNDEILGEKLDKTIQEFQRGEDAALTDIRSINNTLLDIDSAISSAQRAGVVVSKGRYRRNYFAPQLDAVAPLIEDVKRARSSRKKSKSVISKVEGYTPIFDDSNNFLKYVVSTE